MTGPMLGALVPLRYLPRGKSRGALVPWVITVMMYLCGLSMMAGLGLNGALSGWAADLERKATVQVADADPDAQQRTAQAALQALQGMAAVDRARILSDEEVQALLEPWLGEQVGQAGLPIPVLIDVTFRTGRQVDMAAVRARLDRAAPGAMLDDHTRWLGQLKDLTHLLQMISWAVVALVLVTTAAIIVFSTRAGLSGQQRAVRIVHMMGAEDRTIAGEFQYQALMDGLKGGVAGTALCLLTLVLIARMLRDLGGGLLAELTLQAPAVMALVLLPFFAAALTWITARMTVMRALDQMV